MPDSNNSEVFDFLSNFGFPKEWLLENWETVKSLASSTTNEVEFSDLIGDWFDLDKIDGLC